MASSANNVKIIPVNVLWQMEAQALLDFSGLTGADVKGKYLTLSSPSTDYYLWGDDSIEADPAPAGKTGIAYTVTGDGDSDTTLATAAQTAIDAEGDFSATVSGTEVNYKGAAVGQVTDPADVDSTVAITICRRGKDFDCGLLDGDVEKNFAPSNFILTSHQSGVTPRAAINQGFETLEVTTTLQETTDSKLSEIYGLYGSRGFTPAAGTEVYGAGTSVQGDNLLLDAGRVILRPVNGVDKDCNLMLAIPIPDTLTFSGENPRLLSVTWQGFIDDSIDPRANAVLFGDSSQAGLSV